MKPEEIEHPEIREVIYSDEKLLAVVHYVLHKTQYKTNVTENMLHKILYFIDFDFYEIYERSLMGESYLKTDDGPNSQHLETCLNSLQSDAKLELANSMFADSGPIRYLSFAEPDMKCLKKYEISHINSVLKDLVGFTGVYLAEYVQGDMPIIVAEEGEVLDYEFVFYREMPYAKNPPEDEL